MQLNFLIYYKKLLHLVTLDFFVSFCMVLWDVILGWYYNMLEWKLSKQTSYWSKTGFPFSGKNRNNFSSRTILMSSQHNVPKYHTKGHEQITSLHNYQSNQDCIVLFTWPNVENGAWRGQFHPELPKRLS
jgi:hypothetical protein